MKNYTTEKMKNHKNKKQTKKERKIYFTQATFKEKQKASYEKLFSRNILFLKYIIFIIFIKASFSFCNCLSEVTLKTKEGEDIQILSNNFFNNCRPYEVNINGSPQDIKTIHTINSESTIIIRWNIDITSTNEMFKDCDLLMKCLRIVIKLMK